MPYAHLIAKELNIWFLCIVLKNLTEIYTYTVNDRIINLKINELIIFFIQVVGIPSPTLRWFRDGEEIKSGKGSRKKVFF